MIKLHNGSGPIVLPGWINIDSKPYPGVDRVLDVRDGLPFRAVDVMFAEHFLEHLTLAEADRFLRDCRAALGASGVLRLTTPNLDWVWATHYRPPDTLGADHALRGCLELNRAFHGWGHRFLYNFTMLAALLRHCGFRNVVACKYGESDVPALHGIERHEVSPSFGSLESLLIVEASGQGAGTSELPALMESYLKDFAAS